MRFEMKLNQHKTLFIIGWTFILAGCGATAYVQKVTPVKSSLSGYQTVLVNVKAAKATMEKQDGFSESKNDLESHFVTELTNTKRFPSVAAQSNPPKVSGLALLQLPQLQLQLKGVRSCTAKKKY